VKLLINKWQIVPLRSIIGKTGLFTDGDWILSKNMDQNGSVRLLQLADVGVGEFLNKSNKFINQQKCQDLKCTKVQEGDILISRMSDPIARACIIPELEHDLISAVDLSIVRVDSSIADSKFIMFLCNSSIVREQAERLGRGTTRKRITRKALEKFQIPLPPLPIQKKIASILEKAESAREKRREANRLTDEFLKSTFLEMFGDPFFNEKKWPMDKIEQVCSHDNHAIKAGPFGSSLKKEIYREEGFKIYGQEQVIKDDFSYGNYYISSEKYNELENYKIKAGDILISLVGTYGKISIVPEKFEPGIINPRLMKITLNQDLILPIYFKFLLESEGMKVQINNLSHGGTMGIINVGIIKSLRYPIPPMEIQIRFAEIIKKTERLKEKQCESEKKLDNLFNSLMQKAFRGDLLN
jgi:type I restriction enzyme, S subunit